MSEKLLEYFKGIVGFEEWWDNLQYDVQFEIINDVNMILQGTIRSMKPKERSKEERMRDARICFGD